MKIYSTHTKNNGLIALTLGPLLLISIALATINLLSTYKGIHQQKQGLSWNTILLDRKIGNTLYNGQQYINGQQSAAPLQQSYQALLKHVPTTISMIENDKISQQLQHLADPVYAGLQHIQTAEYLTQPSPDINKEHLKHWLNQLNAINQQINTHVLDNVISTKSDYADKAFSIIVKTAAILLALIFTFIIYLSYLLITLRKERKQNLYMLAHDPLTGLSSRECVMTNLRTKCSNKTPFALLSFDLNKFKAVNDTFGHQAGDQLLIHLADKFKLTLSKFGTVGRMGGDEFIWVAESDNPAIIEQQFLLFQKELKTPCIIQGKPIYLHISTGGGIAADHHYQITELLEHVDQAMYQAKAKQIKEIKWEKKLRKRTVQDTFRRKASDKDTIKPRKSKVLNIRSSFPA